MVKPVAHLSADKLVECRSFGEEWEQAGTEWTGEECVRSAGPRQCRPGPLERSLRMGLGRLQQSKCARTAR